MGVIRVLPDRIANQIAAGEVVERPASVVKELLENALDAAATRVEVTVTAGGRRHIRVADNGAGMNGDDALLAFERHATSKLRRAEDLQSIATLGFRGEALPAIAAVSRLTLETCARGDAAGTRVEIAGGKLQRVVTAGVPAGTAIAADDLFFNLPARRKFLKAEATELGHIASVVTNYALAYPEVYFSLQTQQRSILSLAPATNSRDRLIQLFGAAMLDSLLEFSERALAPLDAEPGPTVPPGEDVVPSPPSFALFGFISRPEVQKLNRNSIFTFVNRRLVRDRVIQHAIGEAYRNLLPTNAFPVALLFLEMSFSEVDVNVHPAKVEVRFRRPGFVHDVVRDALRRALGETRPIASFARELRARPDAAAAWKPADLEAIPATANSGRLLGTELAPGFRLAPDLLAPRPQTLPFVAPQALPNSVLGHRATSTACDVHTLASESWLGGDVSQAADGDEIAALRPLGQVRDSFIAAAGPTGLWLIDQHAAHERVLFERLWRQVQARQVSVQNLLLPIVVRVAPDRFLRFEGVAPLLTRAGFEIEPFGHNTLAVKAAPAGFPAVHIEALLEQSIDEGAEDASPTTSDASLAQSSAGGVDAAPLSRLIATIACHAAIKINMRLEPEKMTWLLQGLAEARFPMTCPHGRPVLLRYSMRDIQAAFKRIR